MQGNPQIVAELNKLLKNELTAINQYFLHARMMKHWGFERLAQEDLRGIDRRDEARRQADQAHPAARRPAQPAGPRTAAASARRCGECLNADLQLRPRRAPRWSPRWRSANRRRTSSAARSWSTSWRMPKSTSISSRPSRPDRQGRRAELPANARSARARSSKLDTRRLGGRRVIRCDQCSARPPVRGPWSGRCARACRRRSCRIGGSCRRPGIHRTGGGRRRGRRRRLRVPGWPGRCRRYMAFRRLQPCRCDLLAGAKIGPDGQARSSGQAKTLATNTFPALSAAPRRSDGASCP